MRGLGLQDLIFQGLRMFVGDVRVQGLTVSWFWAQDSLKVKTSRIQAGGATADPEPPSSTLYTPLSKIGCGENFPRISEV